MIVLSQIEQRRLETTPYEWAFVGGLFAEPDATALMATFPRDHFKTIRDHDGEKGYEYEARALISMGGNAPAHANSLSAAWRQLAYDLLSPEYRQAVGQLAERDVTSAPIEVNVFHYGQGAWLGPHVDLRDKILSHIFYFNESWNEADGGSLAILRSANMTDKAACVMPIVGNSTVVVRSDKSWHAVAPVARGCQQSRRSMTVTFYQAGSISTMWPPGDPTPLHCYEEANDAGALYPTGVGRVWSQLRNSFGRASDAQ